MISARQKVIAFKYYGKKKNIMQKILIQRRKGVFYLHHFHAGLLMAEDVALYNPGFPLMSITLDAAPVI